MEATFVMAVVLWALGFTIKEAYLLHDTVTGTMILQEALEKTRYRKEAEQAGERFAAEGEQIGNPRLWLGNYHIEIEEDRKKVLGKAAAGEWSAQIEIKRSCPETFLRQIQALLEKKGG